MIYGLEDLRICHNHVSCPMKSTISCIKILNDVFIIICSVVRCSKVKRVTKYWKATRYWRPILAKFDWWSGWLRWNTKRVIESPTEPLIFGLQRRGRKLNIFSWNLQFYFVVFSLMSIDKLLLEWVLLAGYALTWIFWQRFATPCCKHRIFHTSGFQVALQSFFLKVGILSRISLWTILM